MDPLCDTIYKDIVQYSTELLYNMNKLKNVNIQVEDCFMGIKKHD